MTGSLTEMRLPGENYLKYALCRVQLMPLLKASRCRVLPNLVFARLTSDGMVLVYRRAMPFICDFFFCCISFFTATDDYRNIYKAIVVAINITRACVPRCTRRDRLASRGVCTEGAARKELPPVSSFARV